MLKKWQRLPVLKKLDSISVILFNWSGFIIFAGLILLTNGAIAASVAFILFGVITGSATYLIFNVIDELHNQSNYDRGCNEKERIN